MRLLLIVPMLLGLLLVGCAAAADAPIPTPEPIQQGFDYLISQPDPTKLLHDLPETLHNDFETREKLFAVERATRIMLDDAIKVAPTHSYQSTHSAYIIYLETVLNTVEGGQAQLSSSFDQEVWIKHRMNVVAALKVMICEWQDKDRVAPKSDICKPETIPQNQSPQPQAWFPNRNFVV